MENSLPNTISTDIDLRAVFVRKCIFVVVGASLFHMQTNPEMIFRPEINLRVCNCRY